MKVSDGGLAFPLHNGDHAISGMTMREYFAGQAVVGLLARNGGDAAVWAYIARDAFNVADALIAHQAAEVAEPVKGPPRAPGKRVAAMKIGADMLPASLPDGMGHIEGDSE